MGMVEEVGEGDGKNFNINVPLPPGSGWGAYTEAFEEVVAPALNAFKPELILVSSGFGTRVSCMPRNEC
jgi:acetoin utilization deacetylase AcuC-like enzyme